MAEFSMELYLFSLSQGDLCEVSYWNVSSSNPQLLQLHAEVSLSKILNPKLLQVCLTMVCLCVSQMGKVL